MVESLLGDLLFLLLLVLELWVLVILHLVKFGRNNIRSMLFILVIFNKLILMLKWSIVKCNLLVKLDVGKLKKINKYILNKILEGNKLLVPVINKGNKLCLLYVELLEIKLLMILMPYIGRIIFKEKKWRDYYKTI